MQPPAPPPPLLLPAPVGLRNNGPGRCRLSGGDGAGAALPCAALAAAFPAPCPPGAAGGARPGRRRGCVWGGGGGTGWLLPGEAGGGGRGEPSGPPAPPPPPPRSPGEKWRAQVRPSAPQPAGTRRLSVTARSAGLRCPGRPGEAAGPREAGRGEAVLSASVEPAGAR